MDFTWQHRSLSPDNVADSEHRCGVALQNRVMDDRHLAEGYGDNEFLGMRSSDGRRLVLASGDRRTFGRCGRGDTGASCRRRRHTGAESIRGTCLLRTAEW